MAKIKVKVKDGAFPVRYNGERFKSGASLSIDDKHFDNAIFDKQEETKKDSKKTE